MRRRRLVVTCILVLLGIAAIYWIRTSIVPTIKTAVRVAEIVQRVKPEQAIGVMKVPRKRPATEVPAGRPEFSRECVDLWQDLSSFSIMGLISVMNEAKERGENAGDAYSEFLRGIPDPSRCDGLPSAQGALLADFRSSCAPVLAGRTLEGMSPAERKKLNECVSSATRLRAALSKLATKDERIEDIQDPDLLFERVLHAMNAFHPPGEKSAKLTPERSAEVAQLAERILEVSENESQRQLSVVLLMMTRINDLGLDDGQETGFVDKLSRMRAFAGALQTLAEKYPEDTGQMGMGNMAGELEEMESQLAELPAIPSGSPAPRARPDRK